MKCPKCGYEQPYTGVVDGKRYRDAIDNRLVEYGYPKNMNPQKAQAGAAVRKVVTILTGVRAKSGGGMKTESADKAIAALNIILPPKEGNADV